jgi:PAS domain S-box-containing protein
LEVLCLTQNIGSLSLAVASARRLRALRPCACERHAEASSGKPASETRSAPTKIRDADRDPTPTSDPLRVLLVEDNPGDAELVREALRAHAGTTLVHVERIAEAVDRARAGACDAVLLDLSLPDSFELDGVRRLRAEFPDLPIVVLTSLEDDRVAAQAVAEGAQDYLIKGQIEPSLLLRSLRYAIARQQVGERARLLAEERTARVAAEAARLEAQRAAAALRESERRFRAVLDQVQDYAIFVLGTDGRVASWSKGARLLKGWSQEEIVGRSFESFFPPEEVARGKPGAELERAARDGHFEEEGWRLRKDGSRFLANVVVTALRDDEGRLIGFVKVTRDVTHRRRAERNLEFLARATEALATSLEPGAAIHRLAHTAVPYLADWCGVDLVAEDGTVGDFVTSAFVDGAKDALLHESRRRFPVAAGSCSQVVEALRRGEPVFFPEVGDAELSAIARSAEHVEFLRSIALRSFMAVPLRSRGVAYGAVTFAMTEPGRRFDPVDRDVAVDLARRAELAVDNGRLFAEMQRAVRVREDVLAVVSHDLKTPLTSTRISAFTAAECLARGEYAKVRQCLEAIQRGTQRAERLLRDLRDMASIRAGRMAIRASEEDGQALLAEALQAHEAIARDKGVSLSSARGPGAAMRCDRDRILQVFTNVIANAIKFCATGDRVDVSLEPGERFATFTIRDTGPGIAEDALPHVFEAYWSTARRPDEGTGLGLFISKGIVEAHGGRIWIESRVGRGTAVYFTIPVASA